MGKRDNSTELRPDRFWVVAIGVPVVMYALLGTLLVVFAAAK